MPKKEKLCESDGGLGEGDITNEIRGTERCEVRRSVWGGGLAQPRGGGYHTEGSKLDMAPPGRTEHG